MRVCAPACMDVHRCACTCTLTCLCVFEMERERLSWAPCHPCRIQTRASVRSSPCGSRSAPRLAPHGSNTRVHGTHTWAHIWISYFQIIKLNGPFIAYHLQIRAPAPEPSVVPAARSPNSFAQCRRFSVPWPLLVPAAFTHELSPPALVHDYISHAD